MRIKTWLAIMAAAGLTPSGAWAQAARAPASPPAANDDQHLRNGPPVIDALSGRLPELRLGGRAGAAPVKTDLSYQLFMRRYLTGRSDTGINGSLLNVEGDNAVITGPHFANYLTVQGTITGGGRSGSTPVAQGGRQALFGLLVQKAPTAEANGNRNYVAGAFSTTTYTGDGGTSLRGDGGTRGAYFGINPLVVLKSGASNVFNASAGEINIAAEVGSSVHYKSGLQIAALPSDKVQGADFDAMLALSNQAGAVGWKDGILFGAMNGTHPIDPKGHLLRSSGPGLASFSISAQGVVKTSNLAGAGTRPVLATADGTLTAGAAPQARGPAPSSASSPCAASSITFDKNYVYVCVAENTWRRAPLATW